MEMEEALLIGSLSPGPAKKRKKIRRKSNVVKRPVVHQASRHQIIGYIYIWACWLVYQPLLLSTDLKPIEQRVTIGELKK
jgi:hypothetical protein